MKTQFIKVAQYGTQIPVDQKYQFYCMSSTQQDDPDVDVPISYQSTYKQNSYELIYSSPMRRALSSAKYLGKRVIVLEQLAEIRFDLKKLVTQEEYLEYGSRLVRERFVEAFIHDDLLESRNQVITRVNKLTRYLYKVGENEVVCVSHSFIMKVVEARLKGLNLLRFPELIARFLNFNQRTYEFGGGFIINVQSTRGEL